MQDLQSFGLFPSSFQVVLFLLLLFIFVVGGAFFLHLCGICFKADVHDSNLKGVQVVPKYPANAKSQKERPQGVIGSDKLNSGLLTAFSSKVRRGYYRRLPK